MLVPFPVDSGSGEAIPPDPAYYWQGLASDAAIPDPTDENWLVTTKFDDNGVTDPDGHTTYELQTVSGIGTHGVVFGLYDHGHAEGFNSYNVKGFYGPGGIVGIFYWDGAAWVEEVPLSAPLLGEQWNDEADVFDEVVARYWVYKVYNLGDGTLSENRIGNFVLGQPL